MGLDFVLLIQGIISRKAAGEEGKVNTYAKFKF